GYGSRIVSTKWETVEQSFRTAIRIEGIDRHGILQELCQTISTHLNLNIRAMDIAADHEVFECHLTVMVRDTAEVTDLCNTLKKINGVKSAVRIS
ncbi:MAG: GTP pyrophosphokinase, partial [Paramuribaculum sp.]|nr:GTP pyrophosphokinase [Paramuribaculum sp.]